MNAYRVTEIVGLYNSSLRRNQHDFGTASCLSSACEYMTSNGGSTKASDVCVIPTVTLPSELSAKSDIRGRLDRLPISQEKLAIRYMTMKTMLDNMVVTFGKRDMSFRCRAVERR